MWNRRLANLPDRDRLSVLIGVILLGLALTHFVQLPSRQVGTTVLGSALGVNISGYWIIILVLVIVASAGTDMLIRLHPRLADRRVRATFTAWILPGLTVLAAGWLLEATPNWPLWWTGLIITGVVFGAVTSAEYALIGAENPASSRPRLFLNIIAYLLILILYAAIYQARSRSLITVTATFLLSSLTALDLLRTASPRLGHAVLLSGLIGLVMAECSWALNYWRAGVGTVSLLSLLIFYVAVGLATQHELDKLSPAILVEFAIVAALGAGLLIAFHP